jgi:alkylhydroperoxidase family enzyme
MPRVKEVGGMEGFGGVYANCPDLLKGFMFRYGLIWSHSKLDPVLKDLVRLKSANLNGCRY